MRKELKDFNWQHYGVSIGDYDYTFKLVKEIIKDRVEQLNKEIENIEVYDGDGNLLDASKGEADDAIDDIVYYRLIDIMVIYHFGLWRLQGIFEGILKQEFAQNKKLSGIKAKLDFVIKQGFTITQNNYDELLEWAKLRNAISHHPPEQYKPIALEEDDLKEYLELVKTVTSNLLHQKENKLVNKVIQ